jgi:hypothetical protein
MKLDNIVAAARAEARKAMTWARVGLLAALPFASDIHAALKNGLPDLQPYLPDNIYKFMGGAVVAGGIVLSFIASHRAVRVKDDA